MIHSPRKYIGKMVTSQQMVETLITAVASLGLSSEREMSDWWGWVENNPQANNISHGHCVVGKKRTLQELILTAFLMVIKSLSDIPVFFFLVFFF